MSKSPIFIALAITIASAGSVVSNRAEAGGAMAKTFSNGIQTANVFHVGKRRHAQPTSPPISEYSSSSATKTNTKSKTKP
jgi:hypothetical protein